MVDSTSQEELWGISSSNGGIHLVGLRGALRSLAAAIRRQEGDTLHLTPPPKVGDDEIPLQTIIIRDSASADDLIRFCSNESSLIVEGGITKRTILSNGIANLSAAPYLITPGSVPTHLDIESYPKHAFLDPENPGWITVYIDPKDAKI